MHSPIRPPRAARSVRRRTIAGILALAALSACSVRVSRGDDTPVASTVRAEVQAMLARSAAAWNRGDLDAFMSDYLPGQATTFIGRGGVLRGPEAIRANYASRFAPGATRDSLSFEGLEVDVLAPDAVNTIAWYVLARGDSVVTRGPTSLVLRRVDGRWRIVHDHSS